MERSSLSGFAMLVCCSLWMLGAAAQDDGGLSVAGDDDVCVDDDDLDDALDTFDLGLPDDSDDDDRRISALLVGLCEVPSISTNGRGTFSGDIDDAGRMIIWSLTYLDLEAPVEQAHIHLGERHTNGGISAFLCTNLDNGPPNTQACPEASASINGTITAEQIIGPEDQGISAGEFEELVRGIRSGAAYVNVHTTAFPAGEIRGQVVVDDDDLNDDLDD